MTQGLIKEIEGRKEKCVSLRLLKPEAENLKMLAKSENKNVSDFIRSRIFAQKKSA